MFAVTKEDICFMTCSDKHRPFLLRHSF